MLLNVRHSNRANTSNDQVATMSPLGSEGRVGMCGAPQGACAVCAGGQVRHVPHMTTATRSAPCTPFPLTVAVAGVSWHQDVVSRMHEGDLISVVAEPENPHDPQALRVDWAGEAVGYLPRGVAARLARGQVTNLGGSVVAVVGRETIGLRVELYPLDDLVADDLVADGPSTEQVIVMAPAVIQPVLALSPPPAGENLHVARDAPNAGAGSDIAVPSAASIAAPQMGEAFVQVRGGGRILGTYAGTADGAVLAETPAGMVIPFPTDLVDIRETPDS